MVHTVQRVQGKERFKSFLGGRWPWPSVGPGPLTQGRMVLARVGHLGQPRRVPLTLASPVSAAFCPATAGLYFTTKSQAAKVPLLLATCSPSPRAAAEAPAGTGWSTATDQESQAGAGGVRVGYSEQRTAVSLSGRGKGLGKDEAPRYPIPSARLTVNESLPESWNLGRNNSWLVKGERRSWDKRNRYLITLWCELQPKTWYFILLEFPKEKK